MSEKVSEWNTPGIPRLRAAVATFLVLALVPYVAPGLERFQAWSEGDPVPFAGLFHFEMSLTRGGGDQGGIAAPVSHSSDVTSEAAAELGEGLAGNLGELDIPVQPVVVPEPPTQKETAVESDGNEVQVAGVVDVPPVAAVPQVVISESEVSDVKVGVEIPGGTALDRFFAKLARTARGEAGAITRIAHYGDSTIAADDVTKTLRRNFQKRFGDGGHGFLVPARGTLPYGHRDVYRKESDNWKVTTITSGGLKNGQYGYGGMVNRSYGGGNLRVGTIKDGDVGTKVSKLTVYAEPTSKTAEFKVTVDKDEETVFDTVATEGTVAAHVVDVPLGYHRFSVRVKKGRVSIFGIALETDGPGVVYDSLGLVGAIAKRLLKWSDAHLAEVYALRRPDLFVLQFGGNESAYKTFNLKRYERDLNAVIDKIQKAAPGVDCMLMSPLDQGERKGGRVRTVPLLKDIIAIQERVSAAQGCAYWNTFEAMGGDGSMGRWRKAGLASGDLRHATRKGYQMVGNMAYKALLQSFRGYLSR